MNYEPVIGLEVHVELNTKSKMFCRDSADYFGKEPNTHVCSICLGLPGSLPYINKQAIDYCFMIGLALNCQVSPTSLFERKNYFYPDLPKGYQISQYRLPLTFSGWLEVAGKGGKSRVIRIRRIHMEEDTGKLLHSQGRTLIDFNRSGVPLVEIVTEPDFQDVGEVRDFAQKLQQLFRYLGVSEANMEKGDMRLEANISVREVGTKVLPDYRVELKNINSFRFMVQAIEYEVKRQTEEITQGRTLSYQTRGWDESKKVTFLQREKEEAKDYRYFPEPDLPSLTFSDEDIASLKEELPELPWVKESRFVKDFGIKTYDAKLLSEDRSLATLFEQAAKLGQKEGVEVQTIANFLINKRTGVTKITPESLVEEVKSLKQGIISDPKELEKWARQAMAETPQVVEDYKKGKISAIQVLVGQVMKLSSGKADPTKAREIIEKILAT